MQAWKTGKNLAENERVGYFMVLRRANPLFGALEGVGPGNLDFFGPKGPRFARSYFRAQKSLDFQGPPLPMPLVMDLDSLKTITYRAI